MEACKDCHKEKLDVQLFRTPYSKPNQTEGVVMKYLCEDCYKKRMEYKKK